MFRMQTDTYIYKHIDTRLYIYKRLLLHTRFFNKSKVRKKQPINWSCNQQQYWSPSKEKQNHFCITSLPQSPRQNNRIVDDIVTIKQYISTLLLNHYTVQRNDGWFISRTPQNLWINSLNRLVNMNSMKSYFPELITRPGYRIFYV